jgi:hypothetical protein
MADGVGTAQRGQRLVQPRGVGRQVARPQQLVVRAEQPQLEAARPGVDDEDPQDGQTQSRT